MSTTARYGALDAVAWYDGNSEKKTHDVGQKRPNGFGLYDTLGNVFEWVADLYDAKYDGSRLPSGDHYLPRVVRGGSWDSGPSYARVSSRPWDNPGTGSHSFGVRCAGD